MEFVYVVPREELFPHCTPHGLAPFGLSEDEGGFERETFEARALERGFFVERAYAERAPHLKQVIPYAIVCVGDDVLLVQRTKGGGEARLHHKLSIGIGGHVNPIDAEALPPAHLAAGGTADLFTAATARELEEELHVEGEFTARTVGLLNDDTNPVGAVHLGLVQVIQVRGTVSVREEDQLEGRLVSVEELKRLRAEGADFETWSALLVDALDALLPHTTVSLS
ncbi:MAG: NUDIX domain-containing protein [Planctomycetes bacterium]|nr:NUDIX domain-containing protein [Planctomycetota bacterium]